MHRPGLQKIYPKRNGPRWTLVDRWWNRSHDVDRQARALDFLRPHLGRHFQRRLRGAPLAEKAILNRKIRPQKKGTNVNRKYFCIQPIVAPSVPSLKQRYNVWF